MNYGKPDGAGVTLPIHEQVRQSRAALCGMAPEVTDYKCPAHHSFVAELDGSRHCNFAGCGWRMPPLWGLAPLLTDESTARCVETSNEDKKAELHYRSATVAAMEALARERDDLARRCADLENKIAYLQAENATLRAHPWLYGETESPKAQGPHSPVAPASPPHGMPAALGDCDEVLTDFSLPEPAQLNEAIPASAASQTSAPDGSAPAPVPMPANALRHSR